ncbi:MAG: hypothetical protein OS112_10455 [Methanoregula sp.]|nr:MAG: hypothetical protein OS112_10455 [Methanoregula sp.]
MPRTSVQVSIAPDVFRWLCDTSGWRAEEIAQRIGVPENVVRRWWDGHDPVILPLHKVERLSSAFKRPLAAFLLLKVPDEPALLQDFRKLPDMKEDIS